MRLPDNVADLGTFLVSAEMTGILQNLVTLEVYFWWSFAGSCRKKLVKVDKL